MASANEIEAALISTFEEQKVAGEFDSQLDAFMENEVVPVWQSNSPEDSGDYRDSVQVTQRASGGKGEVSATDEAANIIEWGSEDTKEHAPRAKTIAHFEQR